VRVPDGREVQLSVRRIQVLAAGRPVGQPRDLHLAKHGVQVTLVPPLDTAPGPTVTADHSAETLLARSAKIKLVLQHLAGQLTPVLGQPRLELRMLKPQRLLARRPLDEPRKQRLRALKPHRRMRPRAALLAAHGPPITIYRSRRRLTHRAVSLPGAGEQVEQIRSHATTSVSRSERDITPRLSPPPTETPSKTPRSSAARPPKRYRSGTIYPLQTTCTHIFSLTRVKGFAWQRFFAVAKWSLLAYAVTAGLIEYAFLKDHLRGGALVVLTLSLVIFAVHVPTLIGFTVARYYDPEREVAGASLG